MLFDFNFYKCNIYYFCMLYFYCSIFCALLYYSDLLALSEVKINQVKLIINLKNDAIEYSKIQKNKKIIHLLK